MEFKALTSDCDQNQRSYLSRFMRTLCTLVNMEDDKYLNGINSTGFELKFSIPKGNPPINNGVQK